MQLNAQDNLQALRANPYPGRGIVIGLDSTGHALLQAYWIMGRSENSRNRVFVAEGDARVRTAAADPSRVKDPSLIIYTAMDEASGRHVVTNGDQTDTITEFIKSGDTFIHALRTRQYEPDSPNFTPRISGICVSHDNRWNATLSLLKRSIIGDGCDRQYFEFQPTLRGLGLCVTTYSGDGDPLPSFQGDPYLLPLEGDANAVADTLWGALNAGNRVSLAVKRIDVLSGASSIILRNQYDQKK